jgi:predicted nucleic acid-binding protein
VTSSDRFVLDTNVIVSAVLSQRSFPRKAFNRAFLIGTVLVSDSIVWLELTMCCAIISLTVMFQRRSKHPPLKLLTFKTRIG